MWNLYVVGDGTVVQKCTEVFGLGGGNALDMEVRSMVSHTAFLDILYLQICALLCRWVAFAVGCYAAMGGISFNTLACITPFQSLCGCEHPTVARYIFSTASDFVSVHFQRVWSLRFFHMTMWQMSFLSNAFYFMYVGVPNDPDRTIYSLVMITFHLPNLEQHCHILLVQVPWLFFD